MPDADQSQRDETALASDTAPSTDTDTTSRDLADRLTDLRTLLAATGLLLYCSGRSLEAAEAFAHAGLFIGEVLSKARGAAVSAG